METTELRLYGKNDLKIASFVLPEIKEYDVSFEELTEVVQTEADLNLAQLDVLNVGMRAGAFADNKISNRLPAKKSSTENVLEGQMILKFVGTITNPIPVFIKADR